MAGPTEGGEYVLKGELTEVHRIASDDITTARSEGRRHGRVLKSLINGERPEPPRRSSRLSLTAIDDNFKPLALGRLHVESQRKRRDCGQLDCLSIC